jgi:hypothetical protein
VSNYIPPDPSRLAEAAKVWAKIKVRRAAYRRNHPIDETGVFCPFSSDGKCIGGCPTMKQRACVNGPDEEV